jgi:hypothetical protein
MLPRYRRMHKRAEFQTGADQYIQVQNEVDSEHRTVSCGQGAWRNQQTVAMI